MRVSLRLSSCAMTLYALLVATVACGAPAAPASRAVTPGGGGLQSPLGVAPTRDRVYVVDFDNDRVEAFTRDGASIRRWGGTGSGEGQFRGPAGVAVGADGAVYVADLYNHRVQKFDAEGDFLASWSAGDAGAAPCGVAVDARNRVYVTDLEGGRVLRWSSDDAAPVAWGTRGHGVGELFEPWGIAIDASGDVLVADHGNHRVQRFSADGVFRGTWGESGTGDAELFGPMGLAVARDGSLFLSDLVGGRVRRFTPDGALLTLSRGATDDGLVPSLALDPSGDLLLAETARGQWSRLASPEASSPSAPAAAFALMPIAPMLGAGPATLRLAIPAQGMVGAEVFSLDGRRVFTVPSASREPGEHRITWDARADDGRRAPAGLYFVRVSFNDGVRTLTRSGRIVVLR